MLYIDQPVSTGYSYTKRIHSTLNMLFLGNPQTETGITPIEAYGGSVPPENSTFLDGISRKSGSRTSPILASQWLYQTSNTRQDNPKAVFARNYHIQ